MAGTVIISEEERPVVGSGTIKRIRWEWTSDSSGDVNGTLTEARAGQPYRVVFVPGSDTEQPTDLYDVTIVDEDGVDILQGTGLDRSNAASEQIGIDSVEMPLAFNGTLELRVANAGDANTGTVILYYR